MQVYIIAHVCVSCKILFIYCNYTLHSIHSHTYKQILLIIPTNYELAQYVQ